MIRFLLLALLFFLGYTLFQVLTRSLTGRPGGKKPAAGTRDGEEMVRDPQCGTYLPRSDAVTAVIQGRTHHFCSAACREAFTAKS
jgi:YHS domain-containing protein